MTNSIVNTVGTHFKVMARSQLVFQRNFFPISYLMKVMHAAPVV